MYFQESYFKGEEREGFYVKSMMKRAWAAQLEVLQRVDDICQRHNIQYFADWGTLLGAIRHKGYIPWDDDLDIAMKRVDYMRFINIASKELPQEYAILSPIEFGDWKDWNQGMSRIVNSTTTPVRGENLRQHHGFPYVAGIDIFPLDYLPIDKEEEKLQLYMFRMIYALGRNWNGLGLSEEEKMESLKEIEVLCDIKFTDDKPYREQLILLSDRIASMYWDTGAEAKEIAVMGELVNKDTFRLPVSYYETAIRVPFENTTIPIPIEYEKVLVTYYGEDWRIPIRGTASHEYPYYKRQQDELFKYYEKNCIEIPKCLLE